MAWPKYLLKWLSHNFRLQLDFVAPSTPLIKFKSNMAKSPNNLGKQQNNCTHQTHHHEPNMV